MADRVSARRATANAFFLTINTALLAFLSTGPQDLVRLVAFAGAALSATWWVLIKSYRDLNAAKYGVITDMEAKLEAKMYGDEWERLKQGRVKGWRGRYAEFTTVEQVVPVVFTGLYALVFLRGLL